MALCPSKWHWHHSDCHTSLHATPRENTPTGISPSSCTAQHPWWFFSGCGQKPHLLKVLQHFHKPAGCRQLLYHFYPRNHHKCSPRLFHKLFQPVLSTGPTHSPPSLTFIWKTKENFPEYGHLIERQNQRFVQLEVYAAWIRLFWVVSVRALNTSSVLLCTNSVLKHQNILNAVTQMLEVFLFLQILRQVWMRKSVTSRWSWGHCSNNYT